MTTLFMYVIKCHHCQVNKARYLKVASLLHPLNIPNNKWEILRCTRKGHDVI